MSERRSVAVLWRGDEDARRAGIGSNERLRPVFAALAEVGVDARPVIHGDELTSRVRDELLAVDGILVWIDPVTRFGNRRGIDAVLREASRAGVWVSAHPDVVAAMGTKEVLHRTRHFGWGTDVRRYDTLEELRAGLLAGLTGGARVLKPRYANGGIGVWKVELLAGDPDPVVRVHGAQARDTNEADVPLEELLGLVRSAFEEGGAIFDQPFQPRVAEGLIRCYLAAGRVVGFARQDASSLIAEPEDAARIMGVPSPKTMYPATVPDLARLRSLVEDEWVPAMRAELGLATDDLPVLWDADFLLGPTTEDGDDTYVLCEINCSSVTPFPPEAPDALARVVAERLACA
jgi:hypothetical protein